MSVVTWKDTKPNRLNYLRGLLEGLNRHSSKTGKVSPEIQKLKDKIIKMGLEESKKDALIHNI